MQGLYICYKTFNFSHECNPLIFFIWYHAANQTPNKLNRIRVYCTDIPRSQVAGPIWLRYYRQLAQFGYGIFFARFGGISDLFDLAMGISS